MQIRGRRLEGGQEKAVSAYVHVPYCLSKCPYCDFNSIPSSFPPESEYRYVKAVLAELSIRAADGERRLKSIYFGGGTPTLLSPASIGRVVKAVRESFGAPPSIEITIEANPATIDVKSLALFREAGVNRLSLGVQSFSEKTLKTLGRIHGPDDAVSAIKAGREAGFDNLAVDLIFAVPGQTRGDFLSDLNKLVGFIPEHVSIYGLTFEEATPFGRALRAGELKSAPEEVEADMYEDALRVLTGSGYGRYEISNFSLPGRESVHNQGYWDGRDCIGLGAGAHSYLSGKGPFGERGWNVDGPDRYMELIEGAAAAVGGHELLTREEAMTEALYLGLRTARGVDRNKFRARFGVEPEEAFVETRLFDNDLIEKTGSGLKLTDKGFMLANEVF
jgi:oxygen-independent coproporphyrinogen-3 oxidase